MFIVIDGIDGSGKSTQAKRLASTLSASGLDVVLTAEPTRGRIGTLIRQALADPTIVSTSPHAMALLFAADRLEHVEEVIRPALARGAVVISDRYTLSSIVYQSVTLPNAARLVRTREAMERWVTTINSHAIMPGLTVLIEVPPDVAAARLDQRAGLDTFDRDLELQTRVARAYSRAEDILPGHYIKVDGTGSQDEVARDIWSAIARAYPQLTR